MEQQKIYTVREAAQLLRLHEVTVRRKLRARMIESFRVNGDGGEYRIPQGALDAYMAYREQIVEVK